MTLRKKILSCLLAGVASLTSLVSIPKYVYTQEPKKQQILSRNFISRDKIDSILIYRDKGGVELGYERDDEREKAVFFYPALNDRLNIWAHYARESSDNLELKAQYFESKHWNFTFGGIRLSDKAGLLAQTDFSFSKDYDKVDKNFGIGIEALHLEDDLDVGGVAWFKYKRFQLGYLKDVSGGKTYFFGLPNTKNKALRVWSYFNKDYQTHELIFASDKPILLSSLDQLPIYWSSISNWHSSLTGISPLNYIRAVDLDRRSTSWAVRATMTKNNKNKFYSVEGIKHFSDNFFGGFGLDIEQKERSRQRGFITLGYKNKGLYLRAKIREDEIRLQTEYLIRF